MSGFWPADDAELRRSLLGHVAAYQQGRRLPCCPHPPHEGIPMDDDRRTRQTPAPLRGGPVRFRAALVGLSDNPLDPSPRRSFTITLQTLDEAAVPEVLRACRSGRLVVVTLEDAEP